MISLVLTGRDHHNDLIRRQLRGHGRTCSSGHVSRVNCGLLHRGNPPDLSLAARKSPSTSHVRGGKETFFCRAPRVGLLGRGRTETPHMRSAAPVGLS